MDALNYYEKLILFAKNSKNKSLINNLTKKQNPDKLDYELRKMGLISKKKKVKPTAKKPITQTKQVKNIGQISDTDRVVVLRGRTGIPYEELPKKLQQLWDNNRDNYKLIRSFHEKLKLMLNADQSMREPLCKQITELDQQIHKNWEVIDAWKPGMPVDDEAQVEKEPVVDMDHKRINANRKYISKNIKQVMAGGEKSDYFRCNIQLRFNELKAAGIEMTPKTLAELTSAGIKI